MTDSSVVEKIKKLFAMANRKTNNDGVSNEAEAASAMAKAQELLAKYNLDLAAIQDSIKENPKGGPASGPREKVRIARSAMYRWQQKFWAALAEMNYCFHWIVTVDEEHPRRPGIWREVKRHVILGSQANVTVVQMMGEYLTETLERIIPFENADALSRSAISWREGAADRLIERLRENMRKMKEEGFDVEGTKCTALAVQDLHEKEYAANYDAQYGQGAYVRMKQSQAEWDVKLKERQKKYAEERARTLAGETPEQRKVRERKESKAAAKQAASDARFWERQYRREQREASRRDISAYARGSKAANSINLDSQLRDSKKSSLN